MSKFDICVGKATLVEGPNDSLYLLPEMESFGDAPLLTEAGGRSNLLTLDETRFKSQCITFGLHEMFFGQKYNPTFGFHVPVDADYYRPEGLLQELRDSGCIRLVRDDYNIVRDAFTKHEHDPVATDESRAIFRWFLYWFWYALSVSEEPVIAIYPDELKNR